jgi:hypothetical protein
MRKFILNFLLFSILIGAAVSFVFLLANGNTDPYYLKLTTPVQQSLIIGTSKAAQGLQPSIFDEIIYPGKQKHFYNYSFSLDDSPFGPTYLQSIREKLDPNTKDGIFIVTVDPWSLTGGENEIADTLQFRDANGCLSGLYSVTMNPNIFYLFNSYSNSYYQILVNSKFQKREFLKKDGWLEIRVPMDSNSVMKRTAGKVGFYEETMLNNYKFSPLRLNYLEKTIEFLQKHGTVYIVRIPVTEGIFAVDDKFMPDFDEKMEHLSKKYNAPYLSYRNRPHVYDYTDGNHLYKTSGAVVSAEIANWILEQQAKK